MKAILLGKGQVLANMIESTREAGIEIAGVFRYEHMALPFCRRALHDLFSSAYDLTLIKKYKLPEIKCNSANSEDFRNYVLKTNTDIIMVGTWREKLSIETIRLPKICTVNVHPSILPRYRGPNPYMQVILHGEKKTGVTIHLMDENLDTGAILLQKEVDILPDDTSKELRERLTVTSRELMREFFIKIQNEVIIPIKQNENRATYFGNIDENIKMLDFKTKTAEEIYATIRALHPWLPSYITVGDKFLRVNPYKTKIVAQSMSTLSETLLKNLLQSDNPNDTISEKWIAGEIVAKDAKTRSLTIVCKDGKALQMEDLKLWGFFNRPITGLFIKNLKLKTKI